MNAVASEFLGQAVKAPSNGFNTTARFSFGGKKAPAKKVAPKKTVKKVAPKKTVKKVAPKKVAPKKVVKKVAPKKAAVRKPKVGSGSSKTGDLSKWYGADRKVYLPSGLLDRSEIPAYLDGTLAGDYGFDPLSLGKDGKVDQYRQAELIHARWAMLAIPGALIPEVFNSFTDGSAYTGAVWWETGKYMLEGDGTLKYGGAPNPLPLVVVAAFEIAAFAAIEKYRADNDGPAGQGADPIYPGGRFDPLGLADDPDVFSELRVKEIKNGRLALVAMLGFAVQAAVTKEGPYQNWLGHVNDPFGDNLFTVLGNPERVPTL
eukprot:CAMPEP_0197843716 /NCGR_PEP_ID=MMETSP1438-20131217/642_1 /TAXON_ID=1461541 /ORGANISM="Pterosperma sp., Strain CCMP1384" /LENGTH=316 /DNA_ID=CAMNT_0043454053 /DNA_START=62 /DNA_END=1012 /DNA_ORIENTATION=+